MEIHPGEGGTDSKLFVSDLLSVYQKYSQIKNLKTELLSEENGHVLLKVMGKNVWDAFKHEPGKQVVQRVPPTERSGRWQTSVISVAVLPLPPENKLEQLDPKDLEIIFQTGHQKAGGQNVNRIKSACRMTHKPTGLTVFINGRDQGQNRKEALHILTAKVNQVRHQKISGDYNSLRENQMKGGGKLGGRGDKVRTYNFIKKRVVDHRLGVKTSNIKEVMKGNLSLLLDSLEQG